MGIAPTSPEPTMKSRLTCIHRPDSAPFGHAPKSLAFAMAVLLLPLPVAAQSLCRLLDTVETEMIADFPRLKSAVEDISKHNYISTLTLPGAKSCSVAPGKYFEERAFSCHWIAGSAADAGQFADRLRAQVAVCVPGKQFSVTKRNSAGVATDWEVEFGSFLYWIRHGDNRVWFILGPTFE
ncbi:hypothetical protein [Thauera sp. SDU_THAU2]|uniref:hypothetical protein n=1 Tax=Thauera sp. SDU_THAU2 TaxID=3136633 RepID=UPI00311EF8CF